jgi:type IV secretory pathway TraG/TraD family ATPase VirD4
MSWPLSLMKKFWPRKRPALKGPVKTIRFVVIDLPESETTNHFGFIGSTGSGKSTALTCLLESGIADIGTGVDKRAIVYDAKQDALPLLHAICPKAEILTTNPFDSRSVAWDLAKDIRESRVSIETAFTFIPSDNGETQVFFPNAARHLMHGIMLAFTIAGYDWTLADVLRALAKPNRVKAILKRHPATRDILGKYFFDARLLANIFSTIASKLLPLEPVAAAWEHAHRKVSLKEWSESEMILVLGNSEIGRTAIDAINRCMFKRGSDLTLNSSESFTRRNWFVIDELSEAGRLDGIVSLAKKGRSKGAVLCICIQGLQGLRDSRLYGPHLSEELLAQIGNRFLGRIECPETSEFCSRHIGDQEIKQYTTSKTWSKDGRSTTRAQQFVTRRAVLPPELMSIRPCSRDNGLTTILVTRVAGCFKAHIPGDELFSRQLTKPDPNVPAFMPRDPADQLLRRCRARN